MMKHWSLGLLLALVSLTGCGVELEKGSKPQEQENSNPRTTGDVLNILKVSALKCQFTSQYNNAPVILKMSMRNGKNHIDTYEYYNEKETLPITPKFDGYSLLNFLVSNLTEEVVEATGLITRNGNTFEISNGILNIRNDGTGSMQVSYWRGNDYEPARALLTISDCRQYHGKIN